MNNLETAIFGGGCFWCTEAIFLRLRGVSSVTSGYSGGQTDNPTYEEVSGGRTGHVEAIEVRFDPKIISYSDLLNVFFATHDPTTLNRQGNDIGSQYRSAVFYASPSQRQAAEAFIKKLEEEKIYDKKIVTEISPLGRFWPAESYHQRYYEENSDKPYCQFVISPKVAKLRQSFASLLKPDVG